MNGDAGKLPAAAVYSTTSPETNATSSVVTGTTIPIIPQNSTEFSNMNGAEGNAEFYVAQDNSSSTSNENIISTPDGNPIPLDQLKQLLSSQLEYYFSRYVFSLFFCLNYY